MAGDSELERWGFKWHGHDHGTHVQMPDGYWTPWHLAAARIAALEAALDMAAFRMQMLVDRMPTDEDGKSAKALSQNYVNDARTALERTNP